MIGGNDWHVILTGTEGGRSVFDMRWPIWVVGDVVPRSGRRDV